ncbi:MAG: class I SAM-dependent methyltransferase [Desulfuromonadaceae bacterium]
MPLMALGADQVLKQVPLNRFNSILDVGMGDGTASLYFAQNNKKVTGIGVSMSSYAPPPDIKEKIEIHEYFMDDFCKSFPERKFDAIWASHVIEHTFNPGIFLEQCWDHLNSDGWLFLLTPLNSNFVAGGHYITGWNIGQIVYMLAHFGFDTRNGNYIKYGLSNVAFVQKNNILKEKLKRISLRHDNGDIETLKDFFPDQITAVNCFNGDIEKINWG